MYPKRKKEFVQWSKAMVEGATVGKPSYPGTKTPNATPSRKKIAKRRKRRMRRKKNAKKD